MSGWEDEPVFAGRVALAAAVLSVAAGILGMAALIAAGSCLSRRLRYG